MASLILRLEQRTIVYDRKGVFYQGKSFKTIPYLSVIKNKTKTIKQEQKNVKYILKSV